MLAFRATLVSRSGRTTLVPVVALLGAVAISSPASAHHSFASFDASKCFTLSGTVRNFEWQYPHSWLWVIAPTATDQTQVGDAQVWGFESMSPAQLQEVDSRWNKKVISIGDKVTVTYSPLRDGRHGGSMGKVALANGWVLKGTPNACQGAKAVFGANGLTGNSASVNLPKN